MSSFERACRSVLRSHQIPHFMQQNRIIFQCFKCYGSAEMDVVTTAWKCESGHSGNLKTLVDLLGSCKLAQPTQSFFNPVMEERTIKKMLSRIGSENKHLQSDIESLREKLSKLLCYYRGKQTLV